jgi:hypothetical protein
MSGFGDDDDKLTTEEENLLAQQQSGQYYEAAGGVADAALGLIPVAGPILTALGAGGKLGKFLGDNVEASATKELDLIAKQRNNKDRQTSEQLSAIKGLLGNYLPFQ